jgi:hypothetical protein
MNTVEYIRLLTKLTEQLRLTSSVMKELNELMTDGSIIPYSPLHLLLEELTNNIIDTKKLIQESKKYRA